MPAVSGHKAEQEGLVVRQGGLTAGRQEAETGRLSGLTVIKRLETARAILEGLQADLEEEIAIERERKKLETLQQALVRVESMGHRLDGRLKQVRNEEEEYNHSR